MDNKLNREEAKKLVSNWLNQAFQYDVEINSIYEGENIWLMYFNTKDFLRTGTVHLSLLGSNLILIDKNDSEITLAPHEEVLYGFLLEYKKNKKYPTNTKLMLSILENIQK